MVKVVGQQSVVSIVGDERKTKIDPLIIFEGKNGKDGAQGPQGIQGIPGKDGVDGKNGQDGKDGKDGKDGRDGVDGKDGVSFWIEFDKKKNTLVFKNNGKLKNPEPIKLPKDVGWGYGIGRGGGSAVQADWEQTDPHAVDYIKNKPQSSGISFEVVDELPETGKSNIIYLVPVDGPQEHNIYEEFIWVKHKDGTYGYEKLGTTEIDLSPYRKSVDQDAIDRLKYDDNYEFVIDGVVDNLPRHLYTLKTDIGDLGDDISDLQTNKQNVQITISGITDTVTDHIQTLKNDIGDLGDDISDLQQDKQDVISDLDTIRSEASAGKEASDTIATYGDIVTHNTSEFATAAQGTKADSAVQPAQITDFVTKSTEQTITGKKVITGRWEFMGSGDTNSIQIGTDTRMNLGSTTNTVLGFISNTWTMGHGGRNIQIRGAQQRPPYISNTYGTHNLALYDDIAAGISSHNTSNTAHDDIRQVANEALSRASEKQQSKVFDTFEDMEDWISDVSHKEELLVGDNLYIKDTSVPDYWVSGVLQSPDPVTGYYYNINQLSSEVPDITNMVTTDTAQTITANKDFTGNLQKNGVNVATVNDIPDSYTKTETNDLLNDKQDTISDLTTIRSGASLGATALQSGDNVSELTNNAGYITSAYHDSSKQDKLTSGTNIKTINSTSVLGSGNISVQPTLVSGTNIKTVNGNSLLGSGDITIQGGGSEEDNKSITKNASDKIQTVGVIDQNHTSNAIKTWTGTRDEYDSIASKDSNTRYEITDDDVNDTLLNRLYPVGCSILTQDEVLPVANLIGTWSKTSFNVVTNTGTVGVKGDGVALGFTNGSTGYGMFFSANLANDMGSGYFGKNVGTTNQYVSQPSALEAIGITTDSSKSGMVADMTTATTIKINKFTRTA